MAASSPDPATAAVIARYQASIPQLMAQQGVPGLAVAVVDGNHVLWEQGFGWTDRDRRTPVGVDTIFSVQSMSKLFTSTAVMRAVQEGRLDLDVPITTYLPDFTVHSAFEPHPEQKITLRMLLSHTAGFTHEAPVGNNDALDPGTFDAHVRSISDTWLRFPVGTGYAYSNLGIDVAGAILEKVEGAPFATVMHDELLGPLGMDHSTFDRDRVRATADRAVGQALPLPAPPLDVPMSAAGGLYTSAADLARFLEFQLGDGAIDGQTLLKPGLISEQRTIPAPNAGRPTGYALGVARTRWRLGTYPDLFSHGGGGFGFISDLYWLPGLQLGIAILTDSSSFTSQGDLALSILRDLVTQDGSVYRDRLLALPQQSDFVDVDSQYQPPAGLADRIATLALPPSAGQVARWAGYAGAYRIATWGVVSPTLPPDRFLVESGVPYFDETDDGGTLERLSLTEFEPGLFLAANGQTLDFRGAQPTWRNFVLIPVTDGPLLWQWGLLGVIALVAIAWFAGGLIGIVRRRRRDPTRAEPPNRRWRRLMSGVATVTVILALATIGSIVVIPGLVDSGFLGWLELPLPERLLVHLPLAVALGAGFMLALAIVGWWRRWWSPEPRSRYLAVTVAAAMLATQLAAWHLIGWGFS